LEEAYHKLEQHYIDIKAKSKGLTNHSIRLYLKWFNRDNDKSIKTHFKIDDFVRLVENVNLVLKETDEERFANSSILAGNLIEVFPELISKFKDVIPTLLDICQNKTGLWRKNAGILVAKLGKNAQNMEVIRQLHGIEILSSISSFILEK